MTAVTPELDPAVFGLTIGLRKAFDHSPQEPTIDALSKLDSQTNQRSAGVGCVSSDIGAGKLLARIQNRKGDR